VAIPERDRGRARDGDPFGGSTRRGIVGPGDSIGLPRDHADVNLAAVERRRDRLFDRYGDVPVRDRRFTPDADERERFLLVLDRESSKWGLPGSGHEDDDRLYALRAFFHADYESGSIAIQPGELRGAVWFAEAPADDRLLPATKRLLDEWNGA
jgi:hypothetical protein